MREKILEQQEYLKYKIRRIDQLKNEYDELEFSLEDKDERIAFLERRLTVADSQNKKKALHIAYLEDKTEDLDGEKPLQKATNRKKSNGKIRKTTIN